MAPKIDTLTTTQRLVKAVYKRLESEGDKKPTRYQVAKVMGVPYGTLYPYEAGETQADYFPALRAALFLGIDPDSVIAMIKSESGKKEEDRKVANEHLQHKPTKVIEAVNLILC